MPVFAVSPATLAPKNPSGRIAVTRDGFEIDIDAMPLGEAVRQLAAATQTPADGIEILRSASKRITLKWQGQSAGAAWQQLLSFNANYVSQCLGRVCSQVNVVSLLTPVGASMSTTAANPVAPPSLDPPGLFPADG